MVVSLQWTCEVCLETKIEPVGGNWTCPKCRTKHFFFVEEVDLDTVVMIAAHTNGDALAIDDMPVIPRTSGSGALQHLLRRDDEK